MDLWGAPEQIFASIVEGRPERHALLRSGKIADYQVWQFVAYVRAERIGFAERLPPLATCMMRHPHIR